MRQERPIPAGRRHARRRVCIAILALAGLLAGLRPAVAEETRDRNKEPVPPSIFFPEPDAPTAQEIDEAITNSFGDQSKAPAARWQLVYRYKLLAAPRLIHEVRVAAQDGGKNQSTLWNTLLTLGSMRDVHGPAPQLWAALEPLNRITSSKEITERTFAALALGCWHWAEKETPSTTKGGSAYGSDQAIPRMSAQMEDTLRRLTDASGDFNPQVRVAGFLGLAKRGGTAAGNAAKGSAARLSGAVPEVVWAALIAQAFLRERTGQPYLTGLAASDRRVQRAAALAVSVGALQEGPGELEWVKSPKRMLDALEGIELRATAGPEVVFARGVLTWQRQLTEHWRSLWAIAVDARSERAAAVAATQVLLFCKEDWFRRELVRWARDEGDLRLREEVLAGFLLLAGAQGTTGGVEAAARYLSQPARRPKGTRDWDVRFHASVGLARAFAAGSLEQAALRVKALDTLRDAPRGMHKLAPFRAALLTWLQEHAPSIEADKHYRPSEASVLRLEQSFRCPHALLARDLVDVCVHRVNRFTLRMLQVHNVQAVGGGNADKQNTPLLFLRSYLEAFPYFTRREFLWERGARPPPTLPEGDPRSIDR